MSSCRHKTPLMHEPRLIEKKTQRLYDDDAPDQRELQESVEVYEPHEPRVLRTQHARQPSQSALSPSSAAEDGCNCDLEGLVAEISAGLAHLSLGCQSRFHLPTLASTSTSSLHEILPSRTVASTRSSLRHPPQQGLQTPDSSSSYNLSLLTTRSDPSPHSKPSHGDAPSDSRSRSNPPGFCHPQNAEFPLRIPKLGPSLGLPLGHPRASFGSDLRSCTSVFLHTLVHTHNHILALRNTTKQDKNWAARKGWTTRWRRWAGARGRRARPGRQETILWQLREIFCYKVVEITGCD